ncbi:c-type cytochrome [Aliikangiella coralliicola]|uniref:cytochrome-c oxidase n=1 Tax=Aliikangiella coralliicola TaxID=2592383 RepID=A0A545U7W1_9GAMM|nr:c-type cytochrome [Aliikangiella coralliicola]TQV85555.1 c-type cytochrome [Aliikangiella coralliicola]
MKIAIVLIILVVGSVIFHFVSPWYFTPIASNWGTIDDTINITFWVTGIVFVAVNLFLAYAVIRYQKKKNTKAHYEPENKKLELGLTVFTTVGVAIMLAPGLFVWAKFIEVPEDAHVVEAVGQQWQWTFRFPGKDGVLGKTEVAHITPANPFGINPKDPAGRDDILINSNEVHLPKDKPVKVVLRSKDVLHNFAVPQFRVKMDLVPGMVTYVWFTPIKEGSFEILCEELCGLAHHTMRGRVVVDSVEDYQAWLNRQPTFAQTLKVAEGNPEQGKALYAVCGACHGQNGEGNLAMNSPNLTSLPEWYLVRQLEYYKKGIRGAHKDDPLGQQMAAMAGTLANTKSIRDVAAYISTFSDSPADKTVEGDPSSGYSYYVTCGTCHGKEGEGNFGLSAPQLVGQHDWYIKRQLENFKQGIRGKHPDDQFGFQMVLMARVLQDEQAVDDLIAYLNSLNDK